VTHKRKIIIIGAGLGGLSAAIHLQHNGYDVIIFESNADAGGRANILRENGFSFDTGPTLLNYPFVFENLFSYAGKQFYDYISLLPVDPSVSFFWPDKTVFTLSSDIQFFIRECERLKPGSESSLLKFYADNSFKFNLSFEKLVPKNADSYLKWLSGVKLSSLLKLGLFRSMYGELNKYFKNRYICEALGSYGMYLGGSPFALPGIFSILPYGELAHGLYLPKGGIYGLVQGIEKLAFELGVNIVKNSPVRKIIISGNSVKGVELASGELVQSDIVISNVDAPTTINELIDKKYSQNSVLPKKLLMTPSVITYYLGVKGIGGNFPHHSIYLPENYKSTFEDLFQRYQIPEEIPFYVSVPTATDPSLAPPGHSIFFILVPVPLLNQPGDINWSETVDKIEKQFQKRINLYGFNINQKDIIVKKVLTPLDWQNKFGLYKGSAFGAAHTFFQMGPGRIKNYHPKIKGLFFTGASTTPGTGLPMVVLSGKMTSDRVQQYVC